MDHSCARRWGAQAKVCLGLVVLLLVMGIGGKRAEAAAPFVLGESPEASGVVVYPARAPGPRALTVVLHGMCSEPQNACRHFANQVTETQHLVCPRASKRCAGGGSIWPHVGFVEQIEGAVLRARAALSGSVDEAAGRTLIGYSLGALRGLEVAQQSAGKYPRVMLIGAKIYPNAKLLQQNGVERFLLSAGAWDMMHNHMQRESQRLSRNRVSTASSKDPAFNVRFLGLGPVGHFFTPSFADYLPEALRWLAVDDMPRG